MKLKKISSLLLTGVLTLSMLTQPTYAAMQDPMMRGGEIFWSTESRAATSSIHFTTVGWNITKQSAPGGNVIMSGLPRASISGRQDSERPNPDRPGYVITDFVYPEEMVSTALSKAKDKNNQPLTWKQGETVYFSAINEVHKSSGGTACGSGCKVLGQYSDKSKLQSSQGWSDPSMFDDYYNRPVTLDLAPAPIVKKIFVNGKPYNGNDGELVTKTLPGEVTNVQFPKTLDYNGRQATIVESKFERRMARGIFNSRLTVTDPKVVDRNVTNVVGGTNVIAEYLCAPLYKVEHFNMDTGTVMESKSVPTTLNATHSESKKDFSGLSYVYSEFSYDGGKVWKERNTVTTRNFKVGGDLTLRFYYSANSDLLAVLNMSANPNIIETGKTATVNFTLDGSSSKSKNPISKYEFWLSDTDTFKATPDYTGTLPIKSISKSGVAPDTTWYGKLVITDSKGNKSTATNQVTIESKLVESTAEATAELKLNIIRNSPRILKWDDSWGDEIFLDVLVPNTWVDSNGKYLPVEFDFSLSGVDSESTNGIGNYEFMIDNTGEKRTGSSPTWDNFKHSLTITPQQIADGQYTNDYWSTLDSFNLKVTDSKVPSAQGDDFVLMHYKYIFEKKAPDVKLAINKTLFGVGEIAKFTPTFVQSDETFDIKDKYWRINNSVGDILDSGVGEIPSTYLLSLAEGIYSAVQGITYMDMEGAEQSKEASVGFEVVGIRPPDVSISCDKPKYIAPTVANFKVIFNEDPAYSLPIESRSYKLKDSEGDVVLNGDGEFPDSVNLTVDFDGGQYTAEQTITWEQDGVVKTKTATCKFQVISPKPIAVFDTSMKIVNTPEQFTPVDTGVMDAKQYKRVRVDLSRTSKYNQDLENPHPIRYDSQNTEIQVIPVNADGSLDVSRLDKIYTETFTGLVKEPGYVSIKGKVFADLRFDAFGKYKIRARVANDFYVSGWTSKIINVTEDKSPKVELSFSGVSDDPRYYKTFRNTSDGNVRFSVNALVSSQDDDVVDMNTFRLDAGYDYNANGTALDDGVHSGMYLTSSTNALQSYLRVTPSNNNSTMTFDLYDTDNPILGSIILDYSISEKLTIPDYTGTGLPAVNRPRGRASDLQLPNKRTVFVDNQPGLISIDIGKDSLIDITIVQGDDTLHFDVNTLKSYYGENARIYLIDKAGNRHILN